MRIEWMGGDQWSDKLQSLSHYRFEAVAKLTLAEMFERGKNGGTPVDTGELRRSLHVNYGDMSIGYNKDYAPHVEYGHRVVVHGVPCGYVPGQRYLKKNVDTEKPRFERHCKEQFDRLKG